MYNTHVFLVGGEQFYFSCILDSCDVKVRKQKKIILILVFSPSFKYFKTKFDMDYSFLEGPKESLLFL